MIFRVLVWWTASWACLGAAERVYVGTYTAHGSKGIYRAEFDPATGKLSAPVLAVSTVDPSFVIVSPGKPFLYAVNEGSQKVSAYRIQPGTGDLTLINAEDTGGNGPCHLALDRTGRMLVVANYGGGSLATFPVKADGGIGARATFVQLSGQGPDKNRQAGPHAHSATFTRDNRFVLVDDLGGDRTLVYRVHPETALLEAVGQGTAIGGAGPRHLVIDPQGRFVYVLNEMRSTVTRFAWDGQRGTLRPLDSISALPADFQGKSSAAEIAMDRSGRTIYASNRGADRIAVFRVNGDGTLRQVQSVPSGGKTPRGFILDPAGRWLVAANQESGNVVVFAIDAASGQLRQVPGAIAIPQPVSLVLWE